MSRLSKIYLGTNTKMYKTIAQSVDFVSELQELTGDISREILELFVLPSYTTLESVSKIADKKLISYGSQNMSFEVEGQFTGEISPIMLKEVGATMAMIGHSERREIFNETDEEENKKVLCAINNDLTALLCIGEREADKNNGISDEILAIQLKKGLRGVSDEQAKKIMIAYEPVWAIGVNGKPATKEYASSRQLKIKNVLKEIFSKEIAEDIPVLYGGSVNPENATGLINMDGIDGLFIGRNAWDAKSFNNIIRSVLKAKGMI